VVVSGGLTSRSTRSASSTARSRPASAGHDDLGPKAAPNVPRRGAPSHNVTAVRTAAVRQRGGAAARDRPASAAGDHLHMLVTADVNAQLPCRGLISCGQRTRPAAGRVRRGSRNAVGAPGPVRHRAGLMTTSWDRFLPRGLVGVRRRDHIATTGRVAEAHYGDR
jgi:hypothetical protein